MDMQIWPGSILVAGDGSDDAELALQWAAGQAALENRTLIVLTAGEIDNIVYTTGWAQQIADEAAAKARKFQPGLTVQALAVAGDPREVLRDLSASAYLLVMGSRGRGRLRSMLLGSVSSNLAKYAQCPLIVCRSSTDGRLEDGVMVGADGTSESLPVIEFAFRQASFRDLPLTVVHCYWDAVAAIAGYRRDVELPAGSGGPDVEELRVVMSQSVAGFPEQFPEVSVSVQISHGLVDAALNPRGQEWDLIVVGRYPMMSIGSFLTGSIATAVLERSHSTVAIVPQEGDRD